MSDLTANQDFVWQHYLRAWGAPKKIWRKRIDQATTSQMAASGVRSVGVERPKLGRVPDRWLKSKPVRQLVGRQWTGRFWVLQRPEQTFAPVAVDPQRPKSGRSYRLVSSQMRDTRRGRAQMLGLTLIPRARAWLTHPQRG